MLWPKKALISIPSRPFCAKFNFVLGGREGVASFSNITRKVPTLLTSIVWKPLWVENYTLLCELLQNDYLNAGIDLLTMVWYIFFRPEQLFFCSTSAGNNHAIKFYHHIERFSVICLQSFFLVFVISHVASVALSPTVPGMPNGRYFIVWEWRMIIAVNFPI